MLVKSVRLLFWLAVLVAMLWLYFGAAEKYSQTADLVLLNGKIFTVDDHVPLAGALAAKDGMIVAIGDDRDIRPYIGSGTEVIDLDGRLAIPGFIEGHAHFLSLGQSLMSLDLRDAATWQDIVAMVKAEVPRKKPGEWIVGRGWHQDKWQSAPQPDIDGLPLHHELSRVSPENPVLLTHASGHSCIANYRAMQLAGINSDTPDPTPRAAQSFVTPAAMLSASSSKLLWTLSMPPEIAPCLIELLKRPNALHVMLSNVPPPNALQTALPVSRMPGHPSGQSSCCDRWRRKGVSNCGCG